MISNLMLISTDDGVDQLAVLVRVDGPNLGDKLTADSSIGERHLVLALLELRRVVVAVHDVDDDQRGAREGPRDSTICGDDSDLVEQNVKLLSFSLYLDQFCHFGLVFRNK